MSLPKYQIFIISASTGQTTAYYDATGTYELRYTRLLNDVGTAALVVTLPDNAQSIFADDNYIVVQRELPTSGVMEVEEAYFIRSRELFTANDDERIAIGGLSLNNLLQRRIIDPDDDPLAAGGYSTKSGPADSVMFAYVNEQCVNPAVNIARKFPNFSINPVAGIGQPVGKRVRYDKLLGVLQDLSIEGLVDFQIRQTAGVNMALTLAQIGVDRTRTTNEGVAPFVYLVPERGNLQDPNLRIDRTDEGNFVYVQGQGQGAARVVLKQAGNGVNDTPYNRIEFTADQRQVEKGDSPALVTAALSKLREKQRVIEFTYEPVIGAPGAVYRKDFNIGDYITVGWLDYQEDVRVIGIDVTVNASGENLKLITQARIN